MYQYIIYVYYIYILYIYMLGIAGKFQSSSSPFFVWIFMVS